MSDPRDPEGDPDAPPERAEAWRALDRALSELPQVEPSPTFEARFRARLARAEEAEPGRSLWRWIAPPGLEWLVPALGLVAVAVVLSGGDPALPDRDWGLVADGEGFELVLAAEPELLAALDELVPEASRGKSSL